MELKKITPEQALEAIRNGKPVYTIREIDMSITVKDLLLEELAMEVTEDRAKKDTGLRGGIPEKTGLGQDYGAA